MLLVKQCCVKKNGLGVRCPQDRATLPLIMNTWQISYPLPDSVPQLFNEELGSILSQFIPNEVEAYCWGLWGVGTFTCSLSVRLSACLKRGGETGTEDLISCRYVPLSQSEQSVPMKSWDHSSYL